MKFRPTVLVVAAALALFVSVWARSAGSQGSNGAIATGQSGPELAVELEAARERIRALESQVIRLRAELGAAEDRRIEREREFLRYTEGIAKLTTLAGAMPDLTRFKPEAEVEKPKILETPPEGIETELAATRERLAAEDRARDDARRAAMTSPTPTPDAPPPLDKVRERSRAIFHGLRGLLASEQVTSLDLLESGRLEAGFTGPVVLRVLDERGRPLGSISAERLRLEASRSARMVTIVLEQGYERRSGVKTPFDGGPADAEGRGGVRRIALPDCDPRAWIEGLPELFAPEDLDRSIDDGRVDLGRLRATLNQLLHGEANDVSYRVRGLGGVQGHVLRDVAVDVLDREGRIERRLYADRMTIVRERNGVQLSLEGGSQIRGDNKAPFLDGRYRIFLPRAKVDAWTRAGVPGLEPDVAPTGSGDPASTDAPAKDGAAPADDASRGASPRADAPGTPPATTPATTPPAPR